MTRRLVGAIAAGAFTIGILSGSAGTIVGHDATTPRSELAAVMADHMVDHMGAGDMGSMMSGSMMGPNSSMPGDMGPDASSMPMGPGDHQAHHGSPSPEPTK